MKGIIIFFLLIATMGLYSQTTMKGIIKTRHGLSSKYDTIVVKGIINNRKTGNRFYVAQNSRHNLDYEIKSDKVRLIDSEYGFWQRIWFEHCGYEINTKGWDTAIRRRIDKLTLLNLAALESNGQLFDDRFIQDYLQSLITKIHPMELRKESNHNFSVYILNADSAAIFASNNGVILITTQLIANTPCEEELVRILTYAVAATITDLQFHNFRKQVNLYALSGMQVREEDMPVIQLAFVPFQNDLKLKKIVDAYFKDSQIENKCNANKEEYLNKISYVVSYTAWQEYYDHHYDYALKLINILIDNNLATNEDLLLKSKIYLARADTPESNREALLILEEAEKSGPFLLSDIYKEKGIVLLRLNQPEEAFKAFKKLEEILQTDNTDNRQLKWCRYMMHKCQ
jgi:hypothetical protein